MPKLSGHTRGGLNAHQFDSLSPRTFSYAPVLHSHEKNVDYHSSGKKAPQYHSDLKHRPSPQVPL